ncbi:hypothetical protein CYME_CMN316C [Cyanidioschyzon merolae strain 10D]|jgi:hypothetical protein|uniref:Uncharacterized protein n=1 Tax=Cyanidioschyzon merolae (strain NIES-3377 / 10D) TaxID=280699 RepID=M1V5W6_CYAM1|nr:hypothetical protein CYME_CMN316C [Cyanidioschyzon merolae strain 10D]BAM81385.1 hypothetical protein CYME_CMN316C [Cyanidioschyzon merolae strain 10D]|eukprot:XP_005537421.1 hypothetical protein CYME_CMN316C [Cyanidioschyzon merolae strain 10D]
MTLLGFTYNLLSDVALYKGRALASTSRGCKARSSRSRRWAQLRRRSSRSTGALFLRAVEDESAESELPPVKEPYPGYFRDLERMGVSREQAVAQLREKLESKRPPKDKKIGGKASLYRPDGTPYAPWMIGLVEEEPSKEKGLASRTDARGRLAGDPQAQEIAGIGLRARIVDDRDVELLWRTEGETNNAGFQVSRRRGKSTDWEVIADYKSAPDTLRSKGAQGGAYRFIDTPPEATGTWVYRVSDIDNSGEVSDLSQILVEFESEAERKRQLLVLAALIGTLLLIGTVTSMLDPLSGP